MLVSGCLGVFWISFWVGVAQGSVGRRSASPKEHPWYLSLIIAVLLILPFLFGFLCGVNASKIDAL